MARVSLRQDTFPRGMMRLRHWYVILDSMHGKVSICVNLSAVVLVWNNFQRIRGRRPLQDVEDGQEGEHHLDRERAIDIRER